MRIAFFGGSFDPPHRGHLAIAHAALRRLWLDQVWMAPAGAQPLKLDGFATRYEDRLAMVELAVAGDARIAASPLDAPRDDGRPNFTIDVLLRVKAALAAGDRLFFLLGADAFLSLRDWHRAAELPFICEFIVAGRPGFALQDFPAALPAGIVAEHDPESAGSAETVAWELHDSRGRRSRLYLMPDLHEDIAATEIRAAIAGEESAAGVLCPSVLRYIQQKGLYRE
jgi:nicotinate-nucleotide adenylyltransferase